MSSLLLSNRERKLTERAFLHNNDASNDHFDNPESSAGIVCKTGTDQNNLSK